MSTKNILHIIIWVIFLVSCKEEVDINRDDFVKEDYTNSLSLNSEYIIIIPDIQNYVSYKANVIYLERIILWIKQFDAFGFSVKCVGLVGDIINYNTEEEWERAKRIFSEFNNIVDCVFCIGNHNYGIDGECNDRVSLFNNYFNYQNCESYRDSYSKKLKKILFLNSVFMINCLG